VASGEFVIRISRFIVLSLSSTVVWAAGPVDIDVLYPEGRVLLMKSEQNNVTDAAGMRIVQVHIQEVEEEVLAQEGDTTHLKMTYKRQAMRTSSPMGSMDFDSARDNGPIKDPSFAVLGALVGQSFDVLLAQDLSVVEVQGVEGIAQRIREAMPSDMPSESVEKVVSSFSSRALAKLVSEKTEVVPDSPVNLGESWTNAVEMQLPGVGSMITTSVYTLGSVNGDVATIDFKVSAQMADGNALLTGLNLAGAGVTHFDLQAGYFTDSKVEIKMSGEIQGMPMSVTSTVDVSQTLK
jgi:hypothetical protein